MIKINAVVVGPFCSHVEIDSVLRVQHQCGHNCHLLIADDDGLTTWVYRQTTSEDADHLSIDEHGNVTCDDSHRVGGSPGSRRLGRRVSRVFNR